MKNYRLLTLSLLIVMIPVFACGQNDGKLDSLLRIVSSQKDTVLANTYNEIFWATFIKSPKVAEQYLDSAVSVAKNFSNEGLNARLKLSRATLFQRTGSIKEAREGLKEVITLFEKLKDKENLAKAHNNIGLSYLHAALYKEALNSYMKSLRIKEDINAPGPDLLKSYANIGVLHKTTDNYDLAIDYLSKAEAIAVKKEYRQELQRELAMIRASIAQVYAKTKQYDKSLENYFKSMKYFEESNNTKALATTYENLGWLYERMEDSLDRAEFFYKKSLELCDGKNEKLSCALVQLGLGRVNMNKKKYPAALNYLFEAIETSNDIGQQEVTMNSYKALAQTYAALGNYKKAYIYDTMYLKEYDTIYKAENIKKINELSVQYQTEKKEQQIAQQEVEINLLEEQEKVSDLQKLVLGGGLGLSLTALGFGFYGFRQRNRRNQLEKEKVEAELAFKKKELTTHALHLAKKNEILEHVKQKAKDLKSLENPEKGFQTLIQTINFDQQDDKAWENFTQYFEAVHKDFAKQAMAEYPDVTKNELRLMALMKMNLSSKEIASILNISLEGVKKARQRLRKKMNLSPKDSLETTVMAI